MEKGYFSVVPVEMPALIGLIYCSFFPWKAKEKGWTNDCFSGTPSACNADRSTHACVAFTEKKRRGIKLTLLISIFDLDSLTDLPSLWGKNPVFLFVVTFQLCPFCLHSKDLQSAWVWDVFYRKDPFVTFLLPWHTVWPSVQQSDLCIVPSRLCPANSLTMPPD